MRLLLVASVTEIKALNHQSAQHVQNTYALMPVLVAGGGMFSLYVCLQYHAKVETNLDEIF